MTKKSTRWLSFLVMVMMLISMSSIIASAQFTYVYDEEQVTKNAQNIVYDQLVGPRYEKYEGVYIINSEWAYAEGDEPETVTFTFRDQEVTETYSANRHFSDLLKAKKYADKQKIKEPIYILTAGVYGFSVPTRENMIILGPKAGMNPNVPDEDPTKEWALSSDRSIPASTATNTNGEAVIRPGDLGGSRAFVLESDATAPIKVVLDGLVFQGNGAGVSAEAYRGSSPSHKVYVQNCVFDDAYSKGGRGENSAMGFDMRNAQNFTKELHVYNSYITNQNHATFYSGHASMVEFNGVSFQNATYSPCHYINCLQWQGQRTIVANSHFWNLQGKTFSASGSNGNGGHLFFMGNYDWNANSQYGNDSVEFSLTVKNNSFYNMGVSNKPLIMMGMAGNSKLTVEGNIFIDTDNHSGHAPIQIQYVSYNGKITHEGIGGGSEVKDGKGGPGILVTDGYYLLDENRVSVKNNTYVGEEYQTVIDIGGNTHPDTKVEQQGCLYLDSMDATEGKIINPAIAGAKAYNKWVWLDAAMTQKSSEIFEEAASFTYNGAAIDQAGYDLTLNLGAKDYEAVINAVTSAEDNSITVYKSDATWKKGAALSGTNGDYKLDTSARKSYFIISIVSIDGRTERDYKLIVNRAANPDAQLTDILVQDGITVADKQITEAGAQVNVGYYEDTLVFKPVVSPGATISVRYGRQILVASNGYYTLSDLKIGEAKEATITVSDAGQKSEVYTLVVVRNLNTETELVNVTSPDADLVMNDGGEWKMMFGNEIKNSSMKLTLSPGATVEVTDPIYGTPIRNAQNIFELKDMPTGITTYVVTVTSEDGDYIQTWLVHVDREKLIGCELLSIADAEKIGSMYVAFTPNENFNVSAQVSEGATAHIYTDKTCAEEIANPYLTLTKATTVVWIKVIAQDGEHCSEPVKLIINTYDDPDNNTEHPATLPVQDDGILGVSGGYFDPEGGLVVIPLAPETKQLNLTVQGYADYTARLYSDDSATPMRPANKITLTLDSGRTVLYATATKDRDENAEPIEYTIYVISPRTHKYTDKQTGWAAPYIKDVAENGWGLLVGDNKGAFNGTKKISRYEVATLMVRVAGANVNLYKNSKNPFSDVADDHWAANYVKAAYRMGLVNGVEEGVGLVFLGDNNATRAEFLKILSAAIMLEDVDAFYTRYQEAIDAFVNAQGFKDLAEVADWSKASFYTMIAMGLITGDQDKNINPTDNITRNEVAVVLGRNYDMIQSNPAYYYGCLNAAIGDVWSPDEAVLIKNIEKTLAEKQKTLQTALEKAQEEGAKRGKDDYNAEGETKALKAVLSEVTNLSAIMRAISKVTAANPEVTYAGSSLSSALKQDIKDADKVAKIDIRRGSTAEEKAAFYNSVEALIGSVDFLSAAIASI